VLRLPILAFVLLGLIALVSVATLLNHHDAIAVSSGTPAVPATIEGTVLDDAGEPIAGARVTDGSSVAITGAGGLFSIDTAAPTLSVTASGYLSTSIDTSSGRIEVSLPLQPIRALYMDPKITNDPDEISDLIDLIDRTTANAVVIDIKEGGVWYDTRVEFFRDAGTVYPLYDVASLLDTFKAHHIYTIARLVVFKDDQVAAARPDLAIRHVSTGEPWIDQNGTAWVNPLRHELWDANIDLATEAASFGFDEIQYDYIRFPTDGDLSTMDFGTPLTQEVREGAVEGFLTESRQRLLPTGARQSADVFGFTMVVDDDIGIGQNFRHMAALVDYLCPMVYPSHYSENQFGLPGHPNDYPYEIVGISLDGGVERVSGDSLRIRPWLQDFDLPGMTPYGPEEVRLQIQAAEEHGTSGWMLWDMANRYRAGNLDEESPAGVPNPENVPISNRAVTVTRARRSARPQRSARSRRTPC
jgi:hypothetical protein